MAKKKYPKKTVYYDSFLQDFDGGDLPEKPLPEDFKYVKRSFGARLLSGFLYRCFATPLAFFWSKLVLRERIIGREKLKPYRGGCVFLFGNHTQPMGDAFCPNVIAFPKRNYIIIGRKNLSVPVLGRMTPYLGGLPLPQDMKSAVDFSRAIKERAAEGAFITVYPEAHLWNYCSFLRPFIEESFSYPVRQNAPSFAFTRVYKRCRFGVRSEIYIDGPFLPDGSLSYAESRRRLSEEVREAMEVRLALSDVEVVEYKMRDGADGASGEESPNE